MTKEKTLYALAMRLVAALTFNQYLDLEGNLDVRGDTVAGAVRLIAEELDLALPETIRQLDDIAENQATRSAR